MKKILLEVNGKSIKFDHNIDEIKVINDGVLVLLDIPVDDETLDNIYFVSSDGDILWRIAEPKDLNYGKDRSAYIGFTISDEGNWAIDFFGRSFSFDINTGKIIGIAFVR